MSGHYATLLRSTVVSLITDCEVYDTDGHNARDVPLSDSRFDIEDYTFYMFDFMRSLGPETRVIDSPVGPDATPTDVTDFGRSITMGQLEETMTKKMATNLLALAAKFSLAC